ncbi:nose resistant to fluoxetine protein 6 [Leptinotarsa decemlineata]|uniref:nose resistant to fluoxetine protein 6 n=1 Tax=Leptinotarsa decemlineata TaxID=7539 RepID=UPI003D30C68C
MSTRKAVKLTTRQGILMNQILAVYALDHVQNKLCANHTREFKKGLRSFEPWALQMFDSSSKLQGGILLGNLVDFGSFSQCIKIYQNTDFGPIYGKHCLLKIKPSVPLIKTVLAFRNVSEKRFRKVYSMVEMTEIGWSVCLPHSCPRDDILRHFNKTLIEMAEGLDLEVNLDESYCNSILDQPVMERSQYVVLSIFSSFIIIGVVSGIIDYRAGSDHNNIFLDTFSGYANMQRVLKTGTGKKEMDFLHGLRILSSCYVVVGHRYIMYIMFPVINQLEELDWIIRYSSTLILGSTVSVDSFFMTSGMLVSLGFFEYVSKTGSFNLALFYLHRYLRITLPLALIVLFYATLPQFLGSGPVLHNVYVDHQKFCQDYWWSTLLHLQSYVNPDKLCIYPVWYLSCEVPFYFLSPVILYPLWKYPRLGYVIIVLLFISSMASSFYYAWINEYAGEMLPVTNQLFKTKYFSKYYIAPHIRAAPYIIGLTFGYVIFKTKEKEIAFGRAMNVVLWIISSVLMITAMLGCHFFYLESHDYNKLESSAYLTFSRTAWTVGLVWIMWSCMHGQGGVMNDFLSAHIFKVLSRITYGIFLIHSIVQLYKCGSAKVPMSFSDVNAIYDAMSDLFSSFILAFLFTIFYELPLIRVEGILFKPSKKKVHQSK